MEEEVVAEDWNIKDNNWDDEYEVGDWYDDKEDCTIGWV